MESLLESQRLIIEEMKKQLSNFKKDGKERKTLDHIKRRLEVLDQYWAEFQRNHDSLCQLGISDHDYFSGNHYEQAKKFYQESREYIKQSAMIQPGFLFETPTRTMKTDKPPTPIPGSSQEQAPQAPPPASDVSVTFKPRVSRGSYSNLDEMIHKQLTNFKAFTRTISNVDIDKMSEKWEFEDVLKTLQTRWAAIDSLHWDIDNAMEETDDKYEQEFNQHEQRYYSTKRTINNKLWSISHREKSTPLLEIPIFNGNYQQWPSFKDLFTETIHSNPSLSNAQKMQFLKGKIRGEAERLIQHLQISSENYTTSWEILNHRYNNKKLIFTSHLNILMNLPAVTNQVSSNQIKRLHDVTTECLNAIKNLGVLTDTWDPILVHILSQKLDVETHHDYMTSLKQPKELPSLKEFLDFLESKFTTMESSRRKENSSKFERSSTMLSASRYVSKPFCLNQSNETSKSILQSNKSISQCPLCKNEHGIYYCNQFLQMTPMQKRNTIARLNFCYNCLYNHFGKPCISNKRCRECNKFHNTILHDAFTRGDSTPLRKLNGASHMVWQRDVSEVLLATAIIYVEGANGRQHKMRALVDGGSQVTLLSECAAQQLELPREKCKGVITGVGSQNTTCKGLMNIKISSLHEDFSLYTEAFIMKGLTKNLPSVTFAEPTWAYLKNLQLADPSFYINNPIDVLLGADIYANIIMDGICRAGPKLPIAQRTRLGWILCGKAQLHFHCNIVTNDIDEIKNFWQIEDINDNLSDLFNNDECIKYYKATTKRMEDGKYQVRIPFKENITNKLGHSKYKAIAQFRQLEQKFSKQKNIASEYALFINEYISLGHMKPAATSASGDSNMTPACFLPHHCVLREDSTTTSLRVVFNASAKTSNGTSINDLMHKGPNLQKDLLSLILKWRQYPIALTADIEKMFRQIWVHEDDQNFQKIVWRNSPYEQLREYQLTTVTYGTKSAPFLAMMTLQQLASDEKESYPEAAQVLEESFYMDDMLHGCFSISAAKKLQHDLIKLLKKGGFNLRKWNSNYLELLQPSVEQGQQNNYNFKNLESKTLGLQWDPIQDNFLFDSIIKGYDITSLHHTKRQLLSEISKLFDPLGWLTPISTKLKILFQSVWEANIQWDEHLPNDIHLQWTKIKQDLKNINSIRIPRWLGTEASSDIELHGFCDASLKAYACVVYCKININGQAKIILVAGKSRVVPKSKTITLPRLELCGALLLAKVIKKVKQCFFRHEIKIFGWSDSMAVLGWLQGEPERWKTFVSNRVYQITEIISSDCWRYVKSDENPADCASRGITTSQLKQHSLWWHGPTWLSTFRAEEYNDSAVYVTEEETKAIKVINVVTKIPDPDPIINNLLIKHSNLSKVLRILAWIRRFISKKQDRKQELYITLSEIQQAERIIIKHVQAITFENEKNTLLQNKDVSSKSQIQNLNPYLDDQGILRVQGRLQQAHISFDMKSPIILPHESRLTQLIIDNAHKLTYHGGARVTLAAIRQRYWIVGGNRATKKFIRQCVTCRKQKPNIQHQVMGDLPEARINPSRPFAHTGVDFTGHVFIKANKGRAARVTKGYVAVFVCMVTKAVHLELVSDLTSSAFLAALRRMASRRSAPQHLYSDNGRNFLGSSKILREQYNFLQQSNKEFMAELRDMNITWHFNCPSWPSAGGLWEAAVKSFKFHLKRVIGEQKLTFEEYSTLLTQIEACLNSRPLCALSEDPEDLNYLTPSHFLTSGPTLTIVETETDLRTRWQMTQRILQDVWKRWRSEYLTQLSLRSKWQQPQKNININDVVLINDENLPAGKWAMGRVVELHPGKDGYVRVVTLKTKSGYLKRPVIKLARLLDYEYQEESLSLQKPFKNHEQQTTSKHKKSRVATSKLPSLPSIFTVFLLFMTLIFSSNCNVNVTRFKDNQSLYFDKLSNMQLIREEWKLIIYYNMDPYWQETRAFQKYVNVLENTCATINERIHCDILLQQLRHGFTELEYYNHMLLNQQQSTRHDRRRRRRGLINGVGYIANSLFGVLDENFAEKYEKDITLLRANQKHIAALWKNQTSIVEAEYNILKRTESTFNKQHKLINQHMNELEISLKELKNSVQSNIAINDFTTGAIVISNMLFNLKGLQNTLLDTMTDIYHGRVNFHLLAPEQLINELRTTSSQLPNDVSLPVDDIHADIRKIYNLLKIKTRMLERFLIFEIRLPLISRDEYEILNIMSIPIAREQTAVSILPVSDYICLNMKRDNYIPLSESDVRSCLILSDTYYCHSSKPIYHFREDKNMCKTEKLQCQTVIKPCDNIWRETHTLNTYVYFCCERCQVRVICRDQVTVHQLSGAGLITAEQGCILKTEDFTIMTHKSHVTEMQLRPDFYTPVIAPINNIINLTIPHFTDVNSTEFENHSELAEIKENIETMKESEILADNISYHDIHHYIMIYLLLGVLGLTGLIIGLRRLQCRWTVPGISESSSSAQASTQRTPQVTPRAAAPTASARGSRTNISVPIPSSQEDRCSSPIFKRFTFANL